MARPRARNLPVILAGLLLAGGCSAPVAAQNRSAAAHAVAPAGRPAPAAPAPAPIAPAPPALRAVAVVAPPPAPVSRLWPFKHIYNADFVDVRAIAERYDLKASWVASGRIMQLADAHGRVRLRFENRDRDFYCDGIRVFMGETTVFNQGSLYVSKIDVIKTIVPLLRPAEYASQLPAPPRRIVLDAGHGGNDPGKQNFVLHLDEKSLTLDVVLRLKKLLEGRGYQVLLTRSDDRKIELDNRPAVANETKADLFISVHFNSAEATVTGTETWVLTPQLQISTQPEQDKAMVRAVYPGNHQDFANVLLGYQLHRAMLAGLKTADRGLKHYRYAVLRGAECPAALIEAAFLSNHTEALRIATPEYRQQIAAALADGIDDYSAVLAALHPAPAETRPAPAASHQHP